METCGEVGKKQGLLIPGRGTSGNLMPLGLQLVAVCLPPRYAERAGLKRSPPKGRSLCWALGLLINLTERVPSHRVHLSDLHVKGIAISRPVTLP